MSISGARRPRAETGYGVATGGIGAAASTGVLADGFTYNFLTFSSTSTLSVTKSGLFDVVVVGAGAGGGLFGTGGGGGGMHATHATFFLSANLTVTIGAGSAQNGTSVTGGSSRFGDLLACGGGGTCDNAHDTSLCGASNGGVRTGGVVSRNFVAGQGTGGVQGLGGCGASATSSGDAGGAGRQINTFIGGSSLVLANGGTSGAGAGGANTGNGGGNGAGGSGVVYVRFKV